MDAYAEVFESGDKLNFVIAQTALGEDPLLVGEDVEKELREDHRLDEGEEDFDIQTPEQFAETFGVILDIVQIVLIGIAGIALLVGGIGIMNTMYTTVLERTKEIGILKAIGAKNHNILLIFFIESGMVGLFGGSLGVGLGWGISTLGGRIATDAGYQMLQPIFPLELVIGCLFFALFIGAISGLMPARQASKLLPVDALRYE